MRLSKSIDGKAKLDDEYGEMFDNSDESNELNNQIA